MSRHLHAGANYPCVSLALTGGAIILLVSVIVSNAKQNEDVLKSCEKQADVLVRYYHVSDSAITNVRNGSAAARRQFIT